MAPLDELGQRLQANLPERYELEREIGRGGMAVVYLARERHPSRQVAIKVLDPVVTVGLGRERFLREVDFASNLTHPHIVPIFAAGDAGGLLYFVMPYVSGENLADLIRREGRVEVATALKLTAEIARALEHAHRRDIVHRDIKPENILLHDELALVADFGVARAVRAARSGPVTQDGMTLGTPAYMSPEQAAGGRDVDARADIYALGCVLYHMLAGAPPFGEGPWDIVMHRQVAAPLPPLADRVPGISPDVVAIAERALAKAPEERFPTAQALAEALDVTRSALTSGERSGIGPAASARHAWGPAAVVAVVAVAVTSFLLVTRRAPEPAAALAAAPVSYADSLAVLPIENLTGLTTLDGVADAVTYEVIASLHQVADLKLPAYASVRRLGATPPDPREVTELLGVRLILSSQLRQVAGDVRLDAELVDGRTNEVVNRGSWRVGALSAGVEGGLVRQLVGMVSSGTGLGGDVHRIAGLEGPAYETYRLGKYWLGRRTPQGVRRAVGYFRDAIALDSTYAPAYEGLSSSYMLALFYRYEIGVGGYEAAAAALRAAERAVDLDPRFAAGYAARGYVRSRAYGPVREAARDFNRALDLAPNAGQAVAWSGAVLSWQGRADRAMAMTLRGAELDPLSPATQLSVAMSALPLGRFDLVVSAARRASELEPELVEARAIEGRGLLLAGRLEECLALAFGPHAAIRAMCLHASGRAAEAREIVDSIAAAVARGALGDSLYTDIVRADGLASYYAWVEDHPSALTWLGYAFDRSPMGVDRRVLDSRIFEGLRRDPDVRAQLATLTRAVWPRVQQGAR